MLEKLFLISEGFSAIHYTHFALAWQDLCFISSALLNTLLSQRCSGRLWAMAASVPCGSATRLCLCAQMQQRCWTKAEPTGLLLLRRAHPCVLLLGLRLCFNLVGSCGTKCKAAVFLLFCFCFCSYFSKHITLNCGILL